MCDEGCTKRLKAIPYENRERCQRDQMTSKIVSLKIRGIPVTTGFQRSLYLAKYSKRVAEYLGMSTSIFEMVDWEGHARALDTTGGYTMRRIVWGHHPNRAHLKVTGQYPTIMCLLCGKTETRDLSDAHKSTKTNNIGRFEMR